MGAIWTVAPLEMGPQCRVRCHSVAAALLHHSPSYNLPQFEAKRPKNDRVIRRYFEGDAAGNGAAAPRTAP